MTKHNFLAVGGALLSAAPFAMALPNTPFEQLVLADCGIGLGENGGSTSREMLYYKYQVWNSDGSTENPIMMVNVPWTGSYPWGQDGGVTATMPNGDVFTVHIDRSIKDPQAAGDAWHKYELDEPLKCYSYHKDHVYQLADGKWCSSAYVCSHVPWPIHQDDDDNDNGNDNDDDNDDEVEGDTQRIEASLSQDWVEMYDVSITDVYATVKKTFDEKKSHQCNNTPIPLGSGCSIVWKCNGDPAEDQQSIKRMAAGFGDLAKNEKFSQKRWYTYEVCVRYDMRPGNEGQCIQYKEVEDHAHYYMKMPRYIQMVIDNIPPEGSGRNPSMHSTMSYEITCAASTLECFLCTSIGTALTVPSAGAGASMLITCAATLC